mgnify:CR=1 FL=1
MSDNSSSSESTPLSPADAGNLFAAIESPEVKEPKVNATPEGDDAVPDEVIEEEIQKEK